MTPTEETNAPGENPEDPLPENEAADSAGVPPRPKIDPADLFTLISRMVALLFLSSLAVMYAFSGRFGAMVPLVIVALIVQWGIIRLVNRMRSENPEYIAWRATQEEAEKRERKIAAGAGKGAARP